MKLPRKTSRTIHGAFSPAIRCSWARPAARICWATTKPNELVKQLFHTLRDYYLKLDDGVILYPCHGAGSACGRGHWRASDGHDRR